MFYEPTTMEDLKAFIDTQMGTLKGSERLSAMLMVNAVQKYYERTSNV